MNEHFNYCGGEGVFQYKDIINRLICPICHKKISYGDGFFTCSNIPCAKRYPIINNIPILINEEESIFAIDTYINECQPIINKLNSSNKCNFLIWQF